jgi:hypothetical protein
MAAQVAAMSFTAHSGWAAMVVLGISPNLQVLARSRVELIDSRVPKSKQPYHAVENLAVEEAAVQLRGYLEVAQSMAHSAIHSQKNDLAGRGYHLQCVGVIESASRKQSSLASILASHALIHAADGDHFRNALAAAAVQADLEVCRMPARALEERATTRLRLPIARIQDAVNGLGRQVGAPWGADQKQAALLAWLICAGEK